MTCHKNISKQKTSFGTKPNVLLKFNHFLHIARVLARLESYLIYRCFTWRM